MNNVIFQVICRIGIFMICAQAIVHFRPKESHEKYLKLLVSVMVLLQLFLPFSGIFSQGEEAGVGWGLERFRAQSGRELEDAAQEAAQAEELLERMTLQEVRKRIEERKTSAAEETAAEEQGEAEGAQTAGAEQIPEVTVIVEPIELQSPVQP